jgi:predicted helicase
VTLLDPAAGTMTFIAKATQVATEEFVSNYGEGSRESFLHDHVLQNFYAFELMMAPYAVGHLKMAFFLEEFGYKLKPEERVKFYLTNTLEMEELAEAKLPGLSSLAEESHQAGKVKKGTPILVVLGNPPYSGISSNTGEWITALIEDYKYVDGKHFGEKKHWLQDDYVKFIRFAEWKIAEAGEGVIGMITNHSYLDNPTFRGMRQHLMKTFDEIYVLDLHGNALKKERCPDGSKDENVFDIRQGVAIAFFIKCSVAARLRRSVKSAKEDDEHHVFHTELYGMREAKYASLDTHDQGRTDWVKLDPNSPYYFFVPRNEEHAEQYRKFIPVPEIFPVKVTGIVTARDRFVFDFDRNALLRRINQFQDRSLTDDFIRQVYHLKDTRGWKLSQRRKDFAEMENWRDYVVPCLYRPFDTRSLYYHPYMVDWGRPEVMRHMLAGKNVALITPKQHKDEFGAFTTHSIGAHKSVAAYDINYYFPLYLYPTADRADLFAHHEPEERQPNLNPKLVTALTKAYGKEPSPKDIFHYVYTILYAQSYREKYAEFLRIDFPRSLRTKNTARLHKQDAVLRRDPAPSLGVSSRRLSGLP